MRLLFTLLGFFFSDASCSTVVYVVFLNLVFEEVPGCVAAAVKELDCAFRSLREFWVFLCGLDMYSDGIKGP